jgi:hypothetical protein
MIINPYSFGVSYDPDAQAFFTASGLTGATNLTAINNLVVALKGFGIWTKMKAIYPFIGGTAALHKWNLKDPRDLNAAFRLVFNGTNGYADTFLTPSTSLLQNSSHLSYYSRTQSNGTEVEIGSSTGPNASDSGSLIEIRTSGVTYYRINSQGITYITYTDADSRAFYISNRTATNVINGWRNSAKVATGTIASLGLSTRTFWLAGFNSTGSPFYSKKECAFSSIGDGLTDAEAANFYTAVQAYNTTLSRQV